MNLNIFILIIMMIKFMLLYELLNHRATRIVISSTKQENRVTANKIGASRSQKFVVWFYVNVICELWHWLFNV
ncbi:hypothetical protein C2G38_2084607, partial [Gigaspora rosea]